MNFLYGTLTSAAPLLLASTGALVSEYSGAMAIFLDGLITLSAFFCFAFTIWTKSFLLGIFLAIFAGLSFTALMALLIEKLNANRFLAALALNLIYASLSTTFSSIFFGTRGVLTNQAFVFMPEKARLITNFFAYLVFLCIYLLLKHTKTGLYIRICGSDPQVLHAKGINIFKIRLYAWIIAAALGSCAGCIMSIRLSSFVPNISSGTGWTALAAVFLAKKNTAAIAGAVLAFSLTQYGANNLQNIEVFKSLPPSFLLSLPYISALLLILFFPQIQQRKLKL
ncbi:MAG: ABC transporter permease [Treponema sp.]|nr:ABC transporter permease [Treponema sp.]